jgi:hypothetical protein
MAFAPRFVIDTISLPEFPGMQANRSAMAAAGGALANSLQAHFNGRGSTFWTEIGSATMLTEFTDNEATVGVSPPDGYYLLHKMHGGRVTAKPPRRMLAIPANRIAKAAGWPSHWSVPGDKKLKVLYGKNGPYALALNQDLLKWTNNSSPDASQARLRKGSKGNWGKGVIMYWLKHSVIHKPDPLALPNWALVSQSVVQAYTESMMRQFNNRQSA